MAATYSIKQYADDFKDIKFGATTIGKSGCGICCIAMVICSKAGVSSTADKKAVINAVIATGLSGDSLLNTSKITYNKKDYSVTTDTKKPTSFSNTIIQYDGHFVLAVDNSTVEDPGSSTISTVSGADTKYGTVKKYWIVT